MHDYIFDVADILRMYHDMSPTKEQQQEFAKHMGTLVAKMEDLICAVEKEKFDKKIQGTTNSN